MCALKWFKEGSVFEEKYFEKDILAVDRALTILERWNEGQFIDRHVRLNKPEIWTGCSGAIAGHKLLVEPFIENWQKFNSNTGWNASGFPWGRAMQALSHFSYHSSGGNFLLCDLQGGVYADGAVLTDLVILSRTHEYGVTDLGPQGISSFFSAHVCNEYCRSHWQKPRDQTRVYRPVKGTTMEVVPTQHGRPPMSANRW